MRINTFGKMIWAGYFTVAVVLMVAGILAYTQTKRISQLSEKIRDLREPTVEASYKLLNGINESQAATHRWFLFKEKTFLDVRQDYWTRDINPAFEALTRLSPNWVDEESLKNWDEVKANLDRFRRRQENLLTRERMVNDEYNRNLTELLRSLRGSLEVIVARQNQFMSEEIATQSRMVNYLNISQVILILFGIFACILTALVVIRNISRPINRTIEFANSIADGNFKTSFDISGTLEIERVKVALESMRSMLERRTWLARAQIEFSEAIRRAENVASLASTAVSTLAEQINAKVGLLYLVEGNRLKVAGGYSYPKELQPESALMLGQGLSGQAATKNQVMVVSAGEEQALPLNTMLGDIQLKEALASPLVLRDQVIGVMEFAFAETTTDREHELIKSVSEPLAVTLDATLKSDQVRNLLHETQAQSEELQQQQEELRRANEELQTRQEELESSNEELEEQQSLLAAQKTALDERNQELQAAQASLVERAEELSRVSRYKSEFLANMSHELRTPLNSQLVLSKLLSENKDGNLTDKQLEYAEMIHESGLNLLQLINDILDLSKVEAGKLDLALEEVTIQQLADTMKNDFTTAAEQKGLELRLEVAVDVPRAIRTDGLRVNQILRNLVSNALKFTEKGFVLIHFDRIKEKRDPRHGDIAIHVRDSGVGIPPEKQRVIFDAFEQVDSSISRKYGGTGLGLTISQNLARLLGGEIRLKSELGNGSTFTIVLPEAMVSGIEVSNPKSPLIAVNPEPVAKRPESRAKKKKYRNVLLVEDDKVLRDQMIKLITEGGVKATAVDTAAKAVGALKKENFDCIVLDLNLPDATGLELLKRIDSDKSLTCPPVIVHTAKDLTRKEENELRVYSEAIIIKGVKSFDRLLDEVSLFVHQAVSETPAVAETSKGTDVKKELKGKTALVVDDDVRNIFALCAALEEKGLNVLVARNGQEALDVLEENQEDIDLVLMDIMMPVMDGYEAMKQIRKNKKLTSIPIIALTAKAMREDKEMCLAAGANDYLAKPIDLDRLFTLLRVWIQK